MADSSRSRKSRGKSTSTGERSAPQPAGSADSPSTPPGSPAPATVTRGRGRAALWALPLGVLALASALWGDWYVGLPPGRTAVYIGVQKCATCHPGQFADWKGSNHDRAMEPASEATVLGDFNDRTLEHKNARTGESYQVVSRMFRRDGKFFFHTEGPHGEMQDFQVRYTFGVAPLQQYLVELPGGRMQALNVAWDSEKKQWFLLDLENERILPDDPLLGPLHWTGRALNWNHMCADCHSTNVAKNFDVAAGEFHTTFSEVNVACEACHGPGSIHQELAQARSFFWDRHYGYGLAKLKGKDTKPQIETCAKCHSRRHVIDAGFRPGDEYLDHYIPELLDSASYHPDGQILPAEETYEYGSFLESKMFRKGIRCSDCHNPHSAKLHAPGNALCNRCHTKSNETGVVFDSPAHHFHPVGSKGAQCVECHMPETTYMLVDPRRDHSIRIPRPDVSVQLKAQYGLDVPNACNRCHLDAKDESPNPRRAKPDGDAAWAAGQIDAWYGPKRREVREKHPHFGLAIAGGRRTDPQAIAGLIALLDERQQENVGPIVRASAARLLGRYETAEAEQAVVNALGDSVPLVRFGAAVAIETRPAAARRELLAPYLDDPVRAIRFQAMKGMLDRSLGVPPGEKFDLVAADYLRGMEANSDQAGAHFELGLFHTYRREDLQAVEEFQTALALDPQYVAARRYLANMLLDREKADQADRLMREAATLNPKLAGAHFELGQYLLLDRRQLAEGTAELAKAVELDPANAFFRQQYAAGLMAMGEGAQAVEQLEKACQTSPESDACRLELALTLVQRADASRGLEEIQKLTARWPSNSTYALIAALIAEKASPGRGRKMLDSASTRELLALFNRFYGEGRRAMTLAAARELLKRNPEDEQFRQIVRQLQTEP